MTDAIGAATTVTPVSVADQRREAPVQKPAADGKDDPTSRTAVDAVERTLKSMDPPLMGQNERLSISRDEATGTFIYRSIDKTTGDVLSQWPAESMLQFKAYLRQEGLAIDQRV